MDRKQFLKDALGLCGYAAGCGLGLGSRAEATARSFQDTARSAARPASSPVLPVRQQREVMTKILRKRLDTVLPIAMREAGLDMWLILCQEDDLDPVYKTMIPMDTFPKVLQVLVLFDRGKDRGVERINLSMTDTSDLYDRPWKGGNHPEQWTLLARIVEARDPKRIGVNIGEVNWAAGGLTKNLHDQLVHALPATYVDRLTSAEAACTRWAMTLTDDELELYPRACSIARGLIARCFSRRWIEPGTTTLDDLDWAFWQLCSDTGIHPTFKPYFSLQRSGAVAQTHPPADRIVRGGDLLTCDVGTKYLGLVTDHQENAYVTRPGETDAPNGLKNLLAANNRLQNVFMTHLRKGMTGNQVFDAIVSAARQAGIPTPAVYSHSLGLFLHEPGPVIGLPWDQHATPGRGEVRVELNSCFAMELAVMDAVAEWGGMRVFLPTEHPVRVAIDGCKPLAGIQTSFHLI